MPPPIVSATIQTCILAATSNILAQVIKAYQNELPFVIDWIPVFQFILYGAVNTPPNFLWQEFLESAFPSTKLNNTTSTPAPKSDTDKTIQPQQPRLNKTNTFIKTILDQTVGAAANTLLFSIFMHGIRTTMARPSPGAPLSSPHESAQFLLSWLLQNAGIGASGLQKRRTAVDWETVWQKSCAEFWPIMWAGWKLWPLVSIINFAFVESVQNRNLVGGLAGVGWGVYTSLLAAE